MVAVIYTKPGCGFCDRAKDLLEDYDIVYQEFTIEEYKRVYNVEKCTAPQIFLDGEYVGGYTELSLRMKNRTE